MKALMLAAAHALANRSIIDISHGLAAVGGDVIRLMDGDLIVDHRPEPGVVWNDVIVANDRIVAVSFATSKIAHKPLLGGSWTVQLCPIATTAKWRAIQSIGNNFYFFSNSTDNNQKLVQTSDFINWSTVVSLADSTAESTYFKLGRYNNRLLLPVRNNGNVRSFDINVKALTNHTYSFGTSYVYVVGFKVLNNIAFIFGQGRKIATASVVNGVIGSSFTMRTGVNENAHMLDLDYHPGLGRYVAVGTEWSSSGNYAIMYTSIDGITWTEFTTITQKVGAYNSIQSIVYRDGALYMGTTDGRIFKTTDLQTFTVIGSLPAHVFNIKSF